MTIDEIKASGLLELYALGQLSAREHELVQQYLSTYPSLKKDLQEIEQSLEKYAFASSVKAPASVKDKIVKEISGSTPLHPPVGSKLTGKSMRWAMAAGIATFIALGLLYLYVQRDRALINAENRITELIDSCSLQNQQYLAQIETLRQLTLGDNEILHMTGTEKYPQTDLYFHHNPVTKRNFIQIRNLPAITDNQSYQLWSLKPDSAPIPLDVFQLPGEQVIEVRHIDASQSYAITIEPRGGRQTPTLEDLIGIVNVGS